MTFIVCWDNEDRTVIRTEAVSDWNWDDFVSQIMGAYAMMYTVHHTVDVIADGLGGWTLPPGDMMGRLRSVRGERPPNMGRLVLVNANPFVRAVVGIMGKVYPEDAAMTHLVDTIDDARELLAAVPVGVR
ncbi:MAG: hypothetical protein JXA10_04240 [Anaerolineae bacterium]|nr:hypothetical protein [Anaerolineae bacterium]